MRTTHEIRQRLRLSDEIKLPLFNPMTTSIYFVKLVAGLLFFAGAGMMTNNDEWRIIGASALGGGVGAVVGVFLAVFSTAGNAIVWQVMAMRWAANFMCALLFGGPVALYLNSFSFISNGATPGPILCLASGGSMGIGGVAVLQIFMPLILKWMERKWDSATQRMWRDSTTPPKNPPEDR